MPTASASLGERLRSAFVRNGACALAVLQFAPFSLDPLSPSYHALLATMPVRRGGGLVCTPPATNPVTYSVSILGGRHAPRLTTAQAAVVRAIRRYVTYPTLRFAFLEHSVDTTPPHFIVYDAGYGPCSGGYPVLNGPCNMVYFPASNPVGESVSTGCSGQPPRPWLHGARPR